MASYIRRDLPLRAIGVDDGAATALCRHTFALEFSGPPHGRIGRLDALNRTHLFEGLSTNDEAACAGLSTYRRRFFARHRETLTKLRDAVIWRECAVGAPEGQPGAA